MVTSNGAWLKAHGPCLKAHCSRLMAHGQEKLARVVGSTIYHLILSNIIQYHSIPSNTRRFRISDEFWMMFNDVDWFLNVFLWSHLINWCIFKDLLKSRCVCMFCVISKIGWHMLSNSGWYVLFEHVGRYFLKSRLFWSPFKQFGFTIFSNSY